ncbi:hypothetical protein A9Q83_02445 [Alphaproteobacteria bacterium 46_93_T64]|nr:hypothetical protein A9Q83_02445 [Alphaproteobacteria bacterium 46_93_T64]
MSTGNRNNIVAKELSDAMAKCKQNGVDEQSLRTGLLTITIANFVNRIGMDNTVALFSELPHQISSGIFDRYIDPDTNVARTPAPPPQHSYAQQSAPREAQAQTPQGSYQNSVLPQSFVQPYAPQQNQHLAQPSPASMQSHSHQINQTTEANGRRRLAE